MDVVGLGSCCSDEDAVRVLLTCWILTPQRYPLMIWLDLLLVSVACPLLTSFLWACEQKIEGRRQLERDTRLLTLCPKLHGRQQADLSQQPHLCIRHKSAAI